MRKIVTFLLVFSLFINFVTQTNAQIYKKDDVVLNFGFKGQLWIQSVKDAAPKGRSIDFAVKQLRLYTTGQVTKLVRFGAIMDYNDIGNVDGKEVTSRFTLTDGWIGFYFAPEFQLMVGKFRAPFSRLSLTDTYTGFPFPRSPFSAPGGLVTYTGDYRQIGLTAWGIIGNKLRYNIGVSDREPLGLGGENDPKDTPQYLLRVEFSPIGEDKAYVHVDQYLGKKELVTLGVGYTTKRYDIIKGASENVCTYKAFTVDAYAEIPFIGGSAIIGEAAYFLYDKGTSQDPKIRSYFIQAGYLLPGKIGPGQIQLTARLEEYKPDGIDNNTKSWALGLNYYLKGHDAKVMLEYLKVDNQRNASIYSGQPGKGRDAITLLVQFQI